MYGIELLPGRNHQIGVVISLEMSIFRVGVWRVDPLQSERVAREKTAIYVVVAMANFHHLAVQRGDTVLQNVILLYKFAIVLGDMVHFGCVDERGYNHIQHRNDDESNQHLTQNVVSVSSFRAT